MGQGGKAVDAFLGDEDHAAAVAAVAAVGPAAGDVFLAAEADAAVAPLAGLDADFDFVDEHVSPPRQLDSTTFTRRPWRSNFT